MPIEDKLKILNLWQKDWVDALALWSKYTRLRTPVFCDSHVMASKEGLTESFAMIRLQDQTVVIDLEAIEKNSLTDYGVEILAHEIGHHILAPATLTDHAKMIARMHPNLPTIEDRVGMVANLYSDLLINNHLQRQFSLRMEDIYKRINNTPTQSLVWKLYMRIYEILWQSEKGALHGVTDSDAMEGDAWLGARIIKVYANDWLTGASRFAALLLPYLIEDKETSEQIKKLLDTLHAGQGQFPSGLVQKDASENDTCHPSNDPALTGKPINVDAHISEPADEKNALNSHGQYREPFEYGEILKAAGLNLTDHEIAERYYRERALPWLVRFPVKRQPSSIDLFPESTILWEPGEPIENIDWFSSLSISPVVIPGVTTVQREWGESVGSEPEEHPCNLDLYVDCSGSMPNPQQYISYTALAGAILCLSALRVGASVQVTLWSGTNQFKITQGFVQDEASILNVLTDYFGGGTAFPIHILRKTYIERKPPYDTHVVILSDDGVTTLFDKDELGNSGWDIAQQALNNAKGGGTMVLNLPWDYPATPPEWLSKYHAEIIKAEKQQGWNIYPVNSWDEMVEFAQSFSRKYYEAIET